MSPARFALSLALLSCVACTEPVGVDDGTGVACVLDADCGFGELCIDGVCGSDPAGGGCRQNAECDAGLVCRDGSCAAAAEGGDCTSDASCDEFSRCTVADGDCLPSIACVTGEQGFGCDEACYGHCVPRAACDVDADCPADERCDDVAHVCLPMGPCDDDADCPGTAACLDGACTQNGACTADDDCPTTQSCQNGTCTQNGVCTVDVDCDADQRCDTASGRCTRRGDCEIDDDCGFDERCDRANDGGTCTGIGACDTIDDCPAEPGIACLGNLCTRAPCARDDECDDGLFCTGKETCDPSSGCAAGEPPHVLGAPACAVEVCNEDTNTVSLTPDDTRCDDATPCTDDVCDIGLGCLNPANAFQPTEGLAGDCSRDVCAGGQLLAIVDDADVPAADGCRVGQCTSGAPSTAPSDARCTDAAACTLGTCNGDGTCTQTPSDALCNCDGHGGTCAPGSVNADANGCLCNAPVLTCGVDGTTKQVLQPFALTASATGAAAGATFVWALVGHPTNADPAAQLLVNATQANATFTATTASAPGQFEYVLHVSLLEPNRPLSAPCEVRVQATAIPDKLEITLSMRDPLDVDLHVIGGPDSVPLDFVHHESHLLFGGISENDCHFANCQACTVNVPDQGTCTPTDPRVVDFDGDGAALADVADPQLDIDNQRGCFTGTNGDLQCIPEKVTVEEPAAGTYVVYPYLYGNALAVLAGGATSPSSTTVTLEINCLGEHLSVPRVLSSRESDGTVATSRSRVRYAGTSANVSAGSVKIKIVGEPGANGRTCTITPSN